MKLAIMQPYFFPYLGYFQLINAVDLFIVYDNIKYTKRGWINRNRILQHGRETLLSLPLRSDSDSLHIRDRQIAADFQADKLLNKIEDSYRRAPHFLRAFPVLEAVLRYQDRNLFRFLHHSILQTCAFLKLGTRIAVSSHIPISPQLKGEDKVIALCEQSRAGVYVNAIGGTGLYSRQRFQDRGMELRFIRSAPFEYQQFGGQFVAGLSVIDAMMFNSVDSIRAYLCTCYDLV